MWAAAYETTLSPIVSLERRTLAPWVDEVAPCRAIDVGCGTGRWGRYLTSRGFEVFGLDASAEMLSQAADLRGRLVQADAAQVPIESGTAGLVICALMLEHSRERTRCVQELARLLASGGTLLLSDFHATATANGWRRTFRHDGAQYELESYPYRLDELVPEFARLGVMLEDCAEPVFGEPEREIFDRAGKPELFAACAGIPAILATRWRRS